ncbi:MAG: HEAT repeat domain-containing protein, partial [Candidatus Micrarchaeota archaeon]
MAGNIARITPEQRVNRLEEGGTRNLQPIYDAIRKNPNEYFGIIRERLTLANGEGRQKIIEALGKIHHHYFIPLIAEHAHKSKAPMMKSKAIWALGLHKHENALNHLEKLAVGGDMISRTTARLALMNMKDFANETIGKILLKGDNEASYWAAKWLQKAKNTEKLL